MKFDRSLSLMSFAAAMAASAPALAHVGHAEGGMLVGMLHPVTGVDHLLAMVAVGVLAALRGGKSLVALPALFVAGLVGGAAAGVSLPGLPFVELAIAGSLVAFGLAIARPQVLSAVIMGIGTVAFAFAHGYAHASEAPVTGSMGFFAGMIVATAALHLAGALVMRWGAARPLARIAGYATAATGVALLVAG